MTGLSTTPPAVIEADGKYWQIPQAPIPLRSRPGSGKSSTSRRAKAASPTFSDEVCRSGVICTTGHFRKAHELGLNGAGDRLQSVGHSGPGFPNIFGSGKQPAHAVDTDTRRRAEPCGHGSSMEFGVLYGKSYFAIRAAKIIAKASRDKTKLVVADLDLDMMPS